MELIKKNKYNRISLLENILLLSRESIVLKSEKGLKMKCFAIKKPKNQIQKMRQIKKPADPEKISQRFLKKIAIFCKFTLINNDSISIEAIG